MVGQDAATFLTSEVYANTLALVLSRITVLSTHDFLMCLTELSKIEGIANHTQQHPTFVEEVNKLVIRFLPKHTVHGDAADEKAERLNRTAAEILTALKACGFTEESMSMEVKRALRLEPFPKDQVPAAAAADGTKVAKTQKKKAQKKEDSASSTGVSVAADGVEKTTTTTAGTKKSASKATKQNKNKAPVAAPAAVAGTEAAVPTPSVKFRRIRGDTLHSAFALNMKWEQLELKQQQMALHEVTRKLDRFAEEKTHKEFCFVSNHCCVVGRQFCYAWSLFPLPFPFTYLNFVYLVFRFLYAGIGTNCLQPAEYY